MSKVIVNSMKIDFDVELMEPKYVVDFSVEIFPFQDENSSCADIAKAVDDYFLSLPEKYPKEFSIVKVRKII